MYGPLRRRRMLSAGAYLLVMLIAASVGLDRLGYLGADTTGDWEKFDQKQFIVERVIDGDTIRIRTPAGEEKVRLIGVDAPELNLSTSKPPDHWADRATKYLRARCEGKPVVIRLEQTQTRDRYGRLLAYIYLNDAYLLNQDLIRDGQVYADRRFQHSFRPQFELAENEARTKKRGLWKDLKPEQMPQWRQQWVRKLAERR